MAKRLEFDIVTDPSKGIAGLKEFAGAAKKAMRAVDDSMDDTTTSAQKVARALSGLADEIETEMKGAAKAAAALSDALGPELAGRANVDSVVADLHKMGLTFDEITTDADALSASLRKLDEVQLSAPAAGLRDIADSTDRARAGIDDVGKSAGSSKSVLANMVGNSAQDLGSLGGLAGGAGVAIGQMGEYMADAAADGDKFGTILRNFGSVAGPIAALGVAMQVVSDVMAQRAKSTKAETDSIKQMTEAMSDGEDAVADYADKLREAEEIQGRFGKATSDDLGGIGSVIGKLPGAAGIALKAAGAFGLLGQKTDDFTDDFAAAGITADVWADAVSTGEKGLSKMRTALGKTNLSAGQQRKILEALGNAQEDWTTATKNSAEIQAVFNDRAAQTKAHVEALNQAYKDAAVPQETYNRLLEESADQSDRVNKILEEWATNQQAVSDAVADTTTQWEAMSDEVSEKSFQEALELLNSTSELDLAQMRQDTVGSFDAVKDAIVKASEEVKNWGKVDLTPDSFNELKGMPDELGAVTDAVSGMRGAIQTELQAAFDTAGVKGFTDKFDFFTGQVTEQFTDMFRAMGLPEDQVKAQVGRILADLSLLPETKEIVIKLTREKELANTLDIFKSDIDAIEQAAPTVNIKAQWAEGDLQGALDELNAVRVNLGKDPILLPTDVDRLGAATAAKEARDRAEAIIAANPVKFNSTVLTPTNTAKVLNDTQTTLNKHPLTIPVNLGNGKFRLANGQVVFDSGGTVGAIGGIAAERGPEIINRRFLAVGPTYVPPGTRVTSRRQTARILRTRGTRGLRAYDQGGVVAGGSVNVTVNAGVVGNRYDVMRAVRKAATDGARLMGTRG